MLTSNVFYPNVKEEIPVCCCFKIGQTGEIEFTTLYLATIKIEGWKCERATYNIGFQDN
jgi:hypothetical protein